MEKFEKLTEKCTKVGQVLQSDFFFHHSIGMIGVYIVQEWVVIIACLMEPKRNHKYCVNAPVIFC